MISLFKYVFLSVILLVFSVTVHAMTPDGETPAEETVCTDAGLTGASWGLCNAYCEAMDCDGDPKASANACENVAANFANHSDGALPPCELAECPCFTSELIDQTVAFICSEAGGANFSLPEGGLVVSGGDELLAAFGSGGLVTPPNVCTVFSINIPFLPLEIFEDNLSDAQFQSCQDALPTSISCPTP